MRYFSLLLANCCVLTIDQIRDIHKLLPNDEALYKACDMANSYGYEKTREAILKGTFNGENNNTKE